MLTAQAAFENQLLAKANVVGVAVGLKQSDGSVGDEMAIVVLVEQKVPLTALAAEDRIPREVAGFRTDVYEVGYLRALQAPSHRGRFRPTIPGGVSIGHYAVTAGTLGTMVRNRANGERLILSNNHVLANSNDAAVNDAILQPAALDGGKNPDDMVARLLHFTPLRYLEDANRPPVTQPGKPTDPPPPTPSPDAPGCNLLGLLVTLANVIAALTGSQRRVSLTAASAQTAAPQAAPPAPVVAQTVSENAYDAALARPVNPAMFSDDMQGASRLRGSKPPTLGMAVRKSGRTTGVTDGVITLLNATVNVAYETSAGTKTARFSGQVITQAMSQGGDSGSVVFDPTDHMAVGLLFAGSSVASIFTPIDVVLAGFTSAGFDLEISG